MLPWTLLNIRAHRANGTAKRKGTENGLVELNERHVVRHKLVNDIIDAYGKAGS